MSRVTKRTIRRRVACIEKEVRSKTTRWEENKPDHTTRCEDDGLTGLGLGSIGVHGAWRA